MRLFSSSFSEICSEKWYTSAYFPTFGNAHTNSGRQKSSRFSQNASSICCQPPDTRNWLNDWKNMQLVYFVLFQAQARTMCPLSTSRQSIAWQKQTHVLVCDWHWTVDHRTSSSNDTKTNRRITVLLIPLRSGPRTWITKQSVSGLLELHMLKHCTVTMPHIIILHRFAAACRSMLIWQPTLCFT